MIMLSDDDDENKWLASSLQWRSCVSLHLQNCLRVFSRAVINYFLCLFFDFLPNNIHHHHALSGCNVTTSVVSILFVSRTRAWCLDVLLLCSFVLSSSSYYYCFCCAVYLVLGCSFPHCWPQWYAALWVSAWYTKLRFKKFSLFKMDSMYPLEGALVLIRTESLFHSSSLQNDHIFNFN